MAAKIKEPKVTKKTSTSKSIALTVSVYSLDGQEKGEMSLPESLFGVEVNKSLITQAVRVYLNNQKAHFGNTKTRGEVAGSTRKIYKQKGTGGARHGAIRAPIFVHGGIALGPTYRKVKLDLPEKMRKAALKSALSDKMQAGEVLGLEGLDKVSGKTSQMAQVLKKLAKKDLLLVLGDKNEKVTRATKNLVGVEIVLADQLNTLEVVGHKSLGLTEEAVKKLKSRIMNNEGKSKI